MKRRVIAAFALAPLASPVVFFLLTVVIVDPQMVPTLGAWKWFLVSCIYALPIAYITELLFGVPAWMLCRRYGIRSLAAYALVGALIGWLLVLAFEALAGVSPATALNPFSMDWLRFEFPYLASASASAILFRTIVFSGRTPTAQV